MTSRWLVVAALHVWLTGAHAQAAPPMRIPDLHGTVLTGERVDLPEALKGRVGILVVGFSQSSREEASAWGKRLQGDYGDSSKVIYFELPVLASAPRMLRPWIAKKIGESVPEPARARILPVLDHEAEWKAATAIGKRDDAYVLVVDSGGFVRWKAEGAATDPVCEELKRQVEALRTSEVK